MTFKMFRTNNEFGGYDQFGSLFGQVHLKEDDNFMTPLELNLPGIRQRHWNSYSDERLRRETSLIGVCTDGSMYIIRAQSKVEHLTQ